MALDFNAFAEFLAVTAPGFKEAFPEEEMRILVRGAGLSERDVEVYMEGAKAGWCAAIDGMASGFKHVAERPLPAEEP